MPTVTRHASSRKRWERGKRGGFLGQPVTGQPTRSAVVLLQSLAVQLGEITERMVPVEVLGEQLSALRLCEASAVARVQSSLSSVGQLFSIAVFPAEQGQLEVVDGFKRLRAARALGWSELRAHALAVDPAGAKVALPLDAIASRWVRYYWPLFASKEFLPQMNGEADAKQHRLGFARELQALLDACARGGGLPRYVVQERNGTLPAETDRLRRHLLTRLRSVIRQGPATYAGGSLERGRLFEHDEHELRLSGDLWRELVLMGHWIQDAIVLRWAELTSRLAQGEVTVGRVVTQLVLDAEPLRDTDDARELYAALPDLRCVWTGEPLTRKALAVDHVLPFSLWRSNDLWNLLPAHAAVNASKSDRLPGHRFLLDRRRAVVGYWELARELRPERFEREAEGLAGVARPSLDALFGAMVEAVEVTALQRGAERWAP